MEYYLSVGSEKRGPYSVEELAARGIGAESLVMALDGGSWTPAWQVAELRPIISQQSPARTASDDSADEDVVALGEQVAEEPEIVQGYAPQPSASVGGESFTGNSSPRPRRGRRGGCLLASLVALVLFAGLLVATCPKAEQHREAVSGVVSGTVSETLLPDSASTSDFLGTAMRPFADSVSRQIVSMVVGHALTVDNYLVCSVGRVHYAGKSPVVSVGVLGHVFTVSQSDLKHLVLRYSEDVKQQLEANVRRQVREHIADPLNQLFDDAVDGLMDELEKELLDGDNGAPLPAHPDEDEEVDSL